ncbi:MAG: hypothetical protein ABFS42_13220 [Candidatus Krumholzibacteriota bacterium]
MNRLFSIVFLGTILGLAACSGPNPTAPESALDPAQVQIGESIVRGSKSTLDSPDQKSRNWLDYPLGANKDALIQQTIRQAYKLEKIIWKYIDDWGIPPYGPSGIVPYLPGKKLMINPFTMERTEPMFNAVAMSPGQVGYNLCIGPRGEPLGFVITAWGWDEPCLYLEGGHCGPYANDTGTTDFLN